MDKMKKEFVIGCGLCLVNNDVKALEVGRGGGGVGSRLLIYFMFPPKVSRQKRITFKGNNKDLFVLFREESKLLKKKK
jgi:hypothetical protein